MVKAIGGALVVSMLMLGGGLVLAFVTMLALNGFSERSGARIMMVIAAMFFAVHFAVTTRVAKGLLPEGEREKGRTIGAALTALPALPVFGILLSF
jgi:hypothetical protein